MPHVLHRHISIPECTVLSSVELTWNGMHDKIFEQWLYQLYPAILGYFKHAGNARSTYGYFIRTLRLFIVISSDTKYMLAYISAVHI